MNFLKKTLIILFLITTTVACNEAAKKSDKEKTIDTSTVIADEKQAILTRLQKETEDAFDRNYEAWRTNWVHDSTVAKTYMNFVDSSFTETVGWQEVDDFVRTYIEEHPEPVPAPEQAHHIDVQVFGTGAWVSYRTFDETFGNKRETRLMVKEGGQWKIAGMHTTIYGFDLTKE